MTHIFSVNNPNLFFADCNRTFYAEANVKSPLRMSTPYQRPLPFVCSMTFVAAGGEYGDLVQLTFLSFQIGALEMDKYVFMLQKTTQTAHLKNTCFRLTSDHIALFWPSTNVVVITIIIIIIIIIIDGT